MGARFTLKQSGKPRRSIVAQRSDSGMVAEPARLQLMLKGVLERGPPSGQVPGRFGRGCTSSGTVGPVRRTTAAHLHTVTSITGRCMMRPVQRDLPSGTVTFLFTDIEGSTRLLHDLGPDGYAAALAEHRRILRAAFGGHGGVEVDTQGDAFFVAFPTAQGALAAAAAARDALGFPDLYA